MMRCPNCGARLLPPTEGDTMWDCPSCAFCTMTPFPDSEPTVITGLSQAQLDEILSGQANEWDARWAFGVDVGRGEFWFAKDDFDPLGVVIIDAEIVISRDAETQAVVEQFRNAVKAYDPRGPRAR